jgi:hypothetical protein
MEDEGGGKESEWNEGNLKSHRLDDIQQIINFCKMNPLGITGGKFHYELLVRAIGILYGEGHSLYDNAEIEEVDKIMKDVEKCMRFAPPHYPNIINKFNGHRKTFLFIQKNYDFLMQLLYEFEMKVKLLNNNHGLSTKVHDEEDGL